MRLRPEKIEQIAGLIQDSLAHHPQIKLLGDKSTVIFEAVRAMTEDFEMEDAIEAEAKVMLEAHADELKRSGMRSDDALKKIMKKIAREKRFVL